jgi:hypothetical protein
MPASNNLDRPKRLYDLLRTSRLNAKYYGYKLHRIQRWNKAFEIGIALGATGSGLSGWSIWQSHFGQTSWIVIAGISGIAAIIKPILAMNQTIERYSKLFAGHNRNFIRLSQLCSDIATQRQVTPEMNTEYLRINEDYTELAALDDPVPQAALQARFEREVNSEIPPDSLWWPSDQKAP